MSKIEVGEYVRTKNGVIDKVDFLCEMIENTVYLLKQQSLWFNADYIVKHSKQLIDLIEDKGIVEIELSEEFVEKKDKKKLIQIGDVYTKETLQRDIDNGIITRILTILSYNQYLANCYKVGGEDE